MILALTCGAAAAGGEVSFVDAAASAGLVGPLRGIMAHAAACGDIDSDGDLDLYVGNFSDRPPAKYVGASGPVPNVLLINEGGRFRDSGQRSVVMKARTSGASLLDLDNDGDLDLFVSNNSKRKGLRVSNRLFENVRGRFRDVSAGNAACVIMGGRSVGVLDFDADGLLDLLVTGDKWTGGHTRLFRNKGKLAFEDATARAHLPDPLPGLGVITPDLNEDGRPDIFISQANRLFLSKSDGTYREGGSAALQYEPINREASPCGVAFGDMDRDGRLDIVIVDHSQPARQHLYRNTGLRGGVPQFREVTKEAGLGYRFPSWTPDRVHLKHAHVEVGDFDNDGRPDIFVAATYRDKGRSRPLLCRNLTARGGKIRFHVPPVEKGDAHFPAGCAADFDRDGRLDVFLASWRPELPSKLLLNRGPKRHWLRVQVVGRTINRMGIGAKVKVYEAGKLGRGEALLGYQEIATGLGFCSGQEAVAHFGLGDASRCDVEVVLPFGRGTIRKTNVAADRLLVVRESEKQARPSRGGTPVPPRRARPAPNAAGRESRRADVAPEARRANAPSAAGTPSPAPAAAAQKASVGLFDTGRPSSAALPAEALGARTGWRTVPPGTKDHAFEGDAVLVNDRLGVAFRRGAPGAEVYARAADGWRQRALLTPLGRGQAGKVSAVTVVRNDSGVVSVDARLSAANAKPLVLRCELEPAEPIIKTEPREGVTGLRVTAPCRFGILPDFFADDIVLDAAKLPAAKAEVPSEHFFLHMAGGGEAIVMAAWDTADRDIHVTLSGRGGRRRITASEIAFSPRGKIWVAVLEGAGIWHLRELAPAEGRKAIALGWQMPFPAAWRADFTAPHGLTNSWELIAQQPSGKFRFMKPRPDFFGKGEKEFPANRKGWSTALNSFYHPCWVDRGGNGFVQFGRHRHFQYAGPVILYPLDRGRKTPLSAYTVVDVMRNSLGVGPCEYILDLEGQQSANKGLYTCGARSRLNGIYQRKQQKAKKAEIEKVLTDVLVFVKAIRARIDLYLKFGHETLAYLAEQKKAHPDQAELLQEMARLAREIDARFAARKRAIQTPEYVARLTDEFRKTLVDYEGPDAYIKCRKITAAIVRVGDNQDHLVAECRMAVKVLRQRAGLAMAATPAAEPIAREIRARAHKVLRSQLGHEGALYR